MFLFKPSKPKLIQPSAQSKWVKQLNAYLQRNAAWLQQQTSHLPLRALRMVLILCCVISCSCFSWITISSIYQKSAGVLHVTPISSPQHILDNSTRDNSRFHTNAVERFQQLLDSLIKHKNHDSLQQYLKH